MFFVLSIIPSALFTAAYTYLFLHRESALRTKVAHTFLRSGVSVACYVAVYIASVLAFGAIYLAFDWYTGSETAFRLQAMALTLFASLVSIFVAPRRL